MSLLNNSFPQRFLGLCFPEVCFLHMWVQITSIFGCVNRHIYYTYGLQVSRYYFVKHCPFHVLHFLGGTVRNLSVYLRHMLHSSWRCCTMFPYILWFWSTDWPVSVTLSPCSFLDSSACPNLILSPLKNFSFWLL